MKNIWTKFFYCCMCYQKIYGWGNNAQPLKDGRCCFGCNKKVLLERINNLKK